MTQTTRPINRRADRQGQAPAPDQDSRLRPVGADELRIRAYLCRTGAVL